MASDITWAGRRYKRRHILFEWERALVSELSDVPIVELMPYLFRTSLNQIYLLSWHIESEEARRAA